ncbi:hypothetical protein, partial [Collinsella intestinalis]|uniref:hypothetical protein n=1 Tax=Collinsella intestinalis TaxID=147207 RepID=UPI00195768FB
ADDAETAPPGAVSVPDRCFRPLSWAYAGISPTETTEEPYFLIQDGGIQSLEKLTEKELRAAHNLQKMFKAGSFHV